MPSLQGEIYIDGKKLDRSLIKMVIDTQKHSNDNNVIKFEDNSSAIKGFKGLSTLIPCNPSEASLFQLKRNVNRDIIFTAETHNFPTGVAPFQGATTGQFTSVVFMPQVTSKMKISINIGITITFLSQHFPLNRNWRPN